MKNLLVFELDKYIDNYKLSKQGKKTDKIKRVTAHHLGKSSTVEKAKTQLTDQVSNRTVIHSEVNDNETSEDEDCDMDDHQIIDVIEYDEDLSDTETINDKTLPDILTSETSRYGRKRKQKDYGDDWFLI